MSSVLKLRRHMVMRDEPEAEPVPTVEPEIETSERVAKAGPAARRAPKAVEPPAPEVPAPELPAPELPAAAKTVAVQEMELHEEEPRPRRARTPSRAGFVLKAAAAVAIVGAYPAMIVASSGVGEAAATAEVDRSAWTVAWAGAAAGLIDLHSEELGWTPDAPDWAPAARLVAKPELQAALAASLGEFVSLRSREALTTGERDPELDIAARLLSADSTGAQMHAARDALAAHDRQARRRAASAVAPEAIAADHLALFERWAADSRRDLAAAAELIAGWPVDESATRAVYAAKGRAQAAFALMQALPWPDHPAAQLARGEALAAWRAALEFRPLIVFNGPADGSMLPNHAVAMGFLMSEAEAATSAYREALGGGLQLSSLSAAPGGASTAAE
jgi:hypothetical protein